MISKLRFYIYIIFTIIIYAQKTKTSDMSEVAIYKACTDESVDADYLFSVICKIYLIRETLFICTLRIFPGGGIFRFPF